MHENHQSTQEAVCAYRVGQGVQWAVEARGLYLRKPAGVTRFLDYPEAAVWDLMSRGYPMEKVVAMTAAIAAVGVEESNRIVAAALESWTREGFLVMVAAREARE